MLEFGSEILKSSFTLNHVSYLGMDQYLLIPFLGE